MCPQNDLKPKLLKCLIPLSDNGRGLAIQACLNYRERSELTTNTSIRNRVRRDHQRTQLTLHGLKTLKTGLIAVKRNTEKVLGVNIESLGNLLRDTHIPKCYMYANVEPPVPSAEYFRQNGKPDPAEYLDRFLSGFENIQTLLEHEIAGRPDMTTHTAEVNAEARATTETDIECPKDSA